MAANVVQWVEDEFYYFGELTGLVMKNPQAARFFHQYAGTYKAKIERLATLDAFKAIDAVGEIIKIMGELFLLQTYNEANIKKKLETIKELRDQVPDLKK